MAERTSGRVWAMRGAWLTLMLGLIFLALLPLETGPGGWPGPDLMLALTFAWAVRRPEYLPAVAVAGVFLVADFLFQRPPGLQAALVLIATERLKAMTLRSRDFAYPVEWLNVTLALFAVMIAHRVVLAVLFVEQPPLLSTLGQTVTTAVVYPLVAMVSQLLLGVRRAAPGEVDALGQRL